MDRARFFELETKCSLLTNIAAVQLVTYSTVGAPIAGIQTLKQTLKSHVQTLLEGENMSEHLPRLYTSLFLSSVIF